jgi:hypothetical protein
MRYQACRWYDPYPRLAFALKLLYFSPQEARQQAVSEMERYLDQLLGQAHQSKVLPHRAMANRWYDENDATSRLLERLKHGPNSLKNVFADKLIAVLTRSTPAAALGE